MFESQKVLCVREFSDLAQIVSRHQPRLPVFFHRPPTIFSLLQHLDRVSFTDRQLVWCLTRHKC